jgi:porin
VILIASPGSSLSQDLEPAEDANESESAAKDDRPATRGLSSTDYKAGYATSRPVFGGPNSPEGTLEEADRLKVPAFRFPAIDQTFKPWEEWKRQTNDEHGIQVAASYSTLFQQLSDSIDSEDKASSGFFRGTAKWTLIGKDTPNTGSLNVMVDHRHGFRDTAPAGLASHAGYIGVTGLLYSDFDFAVINLNWQQGFNNGNTGIVVGRYDPNDYMNILGYVNPLTGFSNLAIDLEPSVAFPDASWGVGGGHWIQDQWYVMGGINDANGVATDDLEFFDGGSEFFKWAHVGWSPSKSDRYYKNVHMMAWHVDDRDNAGIDSAHGVAIAANWTFNDRWMPFARAGWSSGSAPIYNESVTLGFIRKFAFRSDLVGIAVNWGDPPDDTLREQTTVEAFWRFQFSQNLAITPSFQLLIDPALNTNESEIWLVGLRIRLTL